MTIEEFGKEKDSLTVSCNSFPFKLWKEWDKDCKILFGNCRWMKMWHDHLASKQLDVFTVLMEQIEILKIRLDKIEKKPEVVDNIPTLGRKVKGGD